MLTQYQLTLCPEQPCRPQPEWAYRLYAALLAQTPGDFASRAHRDGVTPVSQYLTGTGQALRWTVSLLGEESEQALAPVLERLDRVRLEWDRVTLRTEGLDCRTVRDVDGLFACSAGAAPLHRLRFVTAACFKSRGQYLPLPTARLIVQSLIKKWNGCILDCPIEDEDGQGLEALAAGLRPRSFRLYSRDYVLKGSPIPGFVGELTLENRLEGFHRELANALLCFAPFSGVGIKTTLGMGGVEHMDHLS